MSRLRHRLLHVGGNAMDALLLQDEMTTAGVAAYVIECCATLARGVERLIAHPPIALLVDQRRQDPPDIDGLRQLHLAAPAVPVIVLIADHSTAIEQQLLSAGATDILPATYLDPSWLPRALQHVIERRLSERACTAEAHRVERMLTAIGVAVVNTDLEGRVTHLNRYAETLTSWSESEAVGCARAEVLEIVDATTRELTDQWLHHAPPDGSLSNMVTNCVLIRRDRSECAVEYCASPSHDQLGQCTGAKTILRDVSLPHAISMRMRYLATHDALTDLPNRLLLADRLAHAITLARRHSRRLAVLFLDIDRFKTINDSLGHLIGDELLTAVARLVTHCVRGSDTVSRQGGDEFVIVLSELEHAEDAAKGAQTIIAALTRPLRLRDHELFITASIGIGVYPDDGDEVETLLRHADMALYDAKDQGRDCYRFFKPELNLRAIERQRVEGGLHGAIANGEFELHYQPKMNLDTGGVIGVEALIRWRHPERGLIPPGHFIPIAEYSGLIKPIGRWVMREACRQARAWQDAGLPSLPVSVNVSAVEFHAKHFYDHVVEILTETGLDADCLELELTESALMTHLDATTAVLQALKDLGVHISIDDFGTGWSSLSYLRRFPVDALKIDKSFVQEITASSRQSPIVSALISMGKSLHYRVIAEGVETPDQLTFLRDAGCREGQGFYFSQPLMAPQFAQVLQAGLVH